MGTDTVIKKKDKVTFQCYIILSWDNVCKTNTLNCINTPIVYGDKDGDKVQPDNMNLRTYHAYRLCPPCI